MITISENVRKERRGYRLFHDSLTLFLLMKCQLSRQVRWADVEEKLQKQKMRDLGFVVGQTDWGLMTDPSNGESALTKTKYI